MKLPSCWRVAWGLCACCCLAAPSHAATKAQIDQAIGRGAKFLLSVQEADGSWLYPGHPVGSTSLVGLALVESGVEPADPAVQKAVEFVRREASRTTDTYSVALAIMFLDRLEDRANAPAIVLLGERLRKGQLPSGGWTYSVAIGDGAGAGRLAGGDNSNTQFAVLALWVARRGGVDVAAALARTDKYFRASQAQDGGWNYTNLSDFGAGAVLGVNIGLSSSGSMTCAGLLGLAAQHGSQASSLKAGQDVQQLKAQAQQGQDKAQQGQGKAGAKGVAPADPRNDPAVQAGLKCLGQFLGQPPGSPGQVGLGSKLYFLWSVERVGVTYGLQHIGPVDWYAAGADYIVLQQQADGSWPDHAANVGTSLALLFLNRTNVAEDLTSLLSGKPPAAGDSSLRSGRGTEGLKNLAEGRTDPPTPAGAPPNTNKPSAKVAEMTPQDLVSTLSGADAQRRDVVLVELRDRKGTEVTLALVEAIAKLPAESRDQARTMLAERLTRMTAATLGRYLEYDNDEVQAAAAQAAASKQDASLTGKLVDLLEAKNVRVADAAHAALVKRSGQDFGRFPGARTTDRFAIIQRWKTWRAQQDK